MKILVVGDFEFDIYEKAFFDSFVSLEYETYKFKLSFSKSKYSLIRILYKLENKFSFGLLTYILNFKLFKYVNITKPDLIFIYRGRQIFKGTIFKLKHLNKNALIFNYNNDDPFSNEYPNYFWRHYKNSLLFFDHVFCYREKNLQDLNLLGQHNNSILKSYYIKANNYRYNYSNRPIDIVFIGHFENDGRDELINELLSKKYNFKLYGTEWENSKYYKSILKKNGPVLRVDSEKYNNILNQSKISLVFLSHRNNDTYTRRCFEIPATGCVMLSQRSKTLETMFEEYKEILFFDNPQDAINKIEYYLNDIIKLNYISNNAQVRLLKDRHEVKDRVLEVLDVYNTLKIE